MFWLYVKPPGIPRTFRILTELNPQFFHGTTVKTLVSPLGKNDRLPLTTRMQLYSSVMGITQSLGVVELGTWFGWVTYVHMLFPLTRHTA
jgi:hypothetical protein